jgi:hypothetical protein
MAHTSKLALLAVISFRRRSVHRRARRRRPQLARTVGKGVLTCDDTRTLKFTLIIQAMPNSGVA